MTAGKRTRPTQVTEMMLQKEPPGNPETGQPVPPQQGRAGAKPGRKSMHDQQDWLRSSLKKLYDDTAKDPIPETFLTLLEELDRKERESKERARD